MTCNSLSICTQCNTGYLKTSVNTCIQSCTGSTYFNGLTCSNCPAGCSSCSDANTCTGCTNPIAVVSTGQCLTCVSPCATCNPTSATSCLSCLGQLVLLSNNICATSCPYGQTNVNGVCQCTSGLSYNTACVLGCPAGTTNINGQCQSCTNNCAQCSGSTSFCTGCNAGFTQTNNACIQNTVNQCAYGQGLVAGNCVNMCPAGFLYQISTCVASCASGQVANSVNSGCVDPVSNANCPFNQFVFDGQCVTVCPVASYNSGQNCYDCSSNCLICTNYGNCQACNSGYTVNSAGVCVQSPVCGNSQLALQNICVGSCPAGTYLSGSTCELICPPATTTTPQSYYYAAVGMCFI
jgi:proprotein convertase subtilisin/kexin type 5